MKLIKSTIGLALLVPLAVTSVSFAAEKKPSGEKVYADFRLRYENVSQDNPLADADALTLRSRLGYRSADFKGFSATVEIENNFAFVDDYSVPPTGDRVGEFSVIADPEFTELEQAFVEYKGENLSAKIGRQVLTLDGHRFVGHVGWRQDRQTFDGLVVDYKPADAFQFKLSYIAQRNRIFSDERDVDSEDVLLNTSYKTKFGKFVGYAYLLEMDNGTSNGLDTYGISFSGKTKGDGLTYNYAAEIATQEANDRFDAEYLMLQGGITYNGITASLGYELLGSDGGEFGFSTPLATLHKFNGWADVFLATPSAGLEDLSFTVKGKAWKGKWAAVYHEYSADESVAGMDDLGSEINLVYSRKFGKRYSGGVKFAAYDAGDAEFSKVDTDKFWVWMGAKF